MKIIVDENACTGHGRCTDTSPDVYTLDDLGFNRMGTFTAAPGQEHQARRGAVACPERAIAVDESG